MLFYEISPQFGHFVSENSPPVHAQRSPCTGRHADQTGSVHTEPAADRGLSDSSLCLCSVWCQALVPGAGKRHCQRQGEAEEEGELGWGGSSPRWTGWEPGVEENVTEMCCPGNVSVRSLPALYLTLPGGVHVRDSFLERGWHGEGVRSPSRGCWCSKRGGQWQSWQEVASWSGIHCSSGDQRLSPQNGQLHC